MRARDEAQQAVRGLRIVTTDDGLTKSTRIDLGKATITFSDDQGELKMESVDGVKMLTAKDAQGKVLYNGPIDTEEERVPIYIPAQRRMRNSQIGEDLIVEFVLAQQQFVHAREKRTRFGSLNDPMIVGAANRDGLTDAQLRQDGRRD
jgi:hypothetical protein